MEFQIDRDIFLQGIGMVSAVVSQKPNTLPILGNILVETLPSGEIYLMGTDLELGISTQLSTNHATEGAITLPAKKIHEILREIPSGLVEVTVAKNNAVNIKTGRAQFKIMGLTKDDFPKPPEVDLLNAIEIEQGTLKECLNLTSFAVSRDETRYVLNGVYVEIKESKLRLVATDGRRLAMVEKDLPQPIPTPTEMIIPNKAAQELCRILGLEGTVKIVPGKNQVTFHLGKTILTSRLIEGRFPNYEQVVPKEEKITCSVRREDLQQAVRRANLLTSPDSQLVKFDFLKDRVLVSSRTPNLGESREEITAEVKGGELAIGFNPGYLLDVLKNLNIETVVLSLTEPDKPGVVRGWDRYCYVVMPMQLN
ncbi:MAG: DNA polymerase III subunit beta [Candidatus Omnitrophica bacterium]|nr:DNA polymerase III subunit beta [Candidatus Omnitrophota bacterium]